MNLDYTIIEVEPDKNIDIDILHKSMMELGKDKTNDIFTHDDKSSYFSALQLDYQINYTIKKLNCIMDYYKLTRIKLCKDLISSVSIPFGIVTYNVSFSSFLDIPLITVRETLICFVFPVNAS